MNPNASTVSAEQQRKQHQENQTNLYRDLQQKLGTVTEVHETLPLVKVTFIDGIEAAGGKFIGVGHSVLDILARFGKLRPGLRVVVTYSGQVEKNALAFIVGVENEKLGTELKQNNDFNSKYPWEIFTPGIGLGIEGVNSTPGEPVISPGSLSSTSIEIPGLGKVKI